MVQALLWVSTSRPVDLANDAPCIQHSSSARLEYDVC